MLIFIQLFVLFLGILMFKLKLEYKIAIFFFSVIGLDAAIIRFIPSYQKTNKTIKDEESIPIGIDDDTGYICASC